MTFGTLPFLLKAHLSYSQLAVFALATWPYSLKLLWSPIVDAWFVNRWGRRKSWIVPVQGIVGLGLWIIGGSVEGWLETVGTLSAGYVRAILKGQEPVNIRFITAVFGTLIFAAATQGESYRGICSWLTMKISLSTASLLALVYPAPSDPTGWALTLLSPPNLSYASTAQTIGLGIGNALAFTVFLAFNSVDFS